jgi:hypothetical protein
MVPAGRSSEDWDLVMRIANLVGLEVATGDISAGGAS